MSKQDAEIEFLKGSVNCAVLLERLPPAWRLDRCRTVVWMANISYCAQFCRLE
jgi:hypothetical protein